MNTEKRDRGSEIVQKIETRDRKRVDRQRKSRR